MAPRTECAESTAALEKAIDSFAQQSHDAEDFDKPWYDIFLAARSLSTDYYTIVTLAGKVNCSERTKIIELLEQARDTIPQDVKVAFHEQIEGWIKDALRLPTEIMEMERDEDLPYF